MSNTFIFKQYDNIGNPSAEADEQFLLACFVDNGELNISVTVMINVE